MHRWGHFGKLSASLGTLRQAQCIAGDWGHFGKLSASLGAGDTSASSVHRWGLGKMGRIITPNSLLITHYSLLLTHYSLLPIPNPQSPIASSDIWGYSTWRSLLFLL
ncbi:MAG: hypothetical protein KA716_24120 [Gloeotrichia echinulata DEX184]|nr:hypothetical protein [Gloeotrichia echinulata DEX184]